MSKIDVKEFRTVDSKLLDTLYGLEVKIFDEPYPRQKIASEAAKKHNLIALIAYIDHEPVGYKVGYELTGRVFYSWIGGVVPERRGAGVARKLMTIQHDTIKHMGYQTVQTHTENKFREMLLLNIRCGFDITGVMYADHKNTLKIILEKTLEN